ncbi:hypothetical protein ACIQNU_20010 [Streptomyces sp. NPDC091292]
MGLPDTATNAIGYALVGGLLDEGFAENLEVAPPPPSCAPCGRRD